MKEYLDRQTKLKEKNLKYDFLPSMIEIIERPANRLGTLIMILIAALIISAVIWAALFKIDIAVTATGTVMPEGGIVTLSSIRGGRIKEICVEDGSYVRKGDVILILEAKDAEISLEEYRYELEVFLVQREIYGIVYDALMAGEETEELKAAYLKDYKEHSAIAEAVLLDNEIFTKELNKRDNEEEKESIKEQYRLTILQNINNLNSKIAGAKLKLEGAENELNEYKITAPSDGKITQMTSVYEGLLIEAGSRVGCLVSEEKVKVFTAYVSDKDAGQINIGDIVGVKIAAYDNTEYEYMEGEIVSIGDIALNMEKLGSVYMVEIRIPNIPDNIKAGMEGSCDIIIGQRSVLDYFLEPFKNGLNDSLKER